MLIRVDGRHDGVKQYLEEGQKVGRELARDELDERVVLAGDLDITDMVIQSIDVAPNVDRYLSITLSFKEDYVERETLQAIVRDFERFAMRAYRPDEYCFYAEAHLPRVKSYVDQKTGELVERKPHIHIVIPKQNLISGQHLEPLGYVKSNLKFIDAFQEYTNAIYGLASPKDNRRTVLTDASEMIARYRGDLFRSTSRELKEQLLDAILDRKIERHADFMALLREYGEVRVRNAGRENAYPNVKPAEAQKGINLKEYVFSPAFIEFPGAEKLRVLSADAADHYEAVGLQRRAPTELKAVLDAWITTRAREVKYLNSGSRTYRIYQESSPQDRQRLLAELERGFYAQHLKDHHERADERIPGFDEHLRQLGRLYDLGGRGSGDDGFPEFQSGTGFGAVGGHPTAPGFGPGPGAAFDSEFSSGFDTAFDAVHRQFDFVPDRPRAPSQPRDRLRNLPGGTLDGFGARPPMLLPDHANHELELDVPVPTHRLRRDTNRDGELAAQRVTGRVADNVASQVAHDARQRRGAGAQANEFAEIRRELDPRRLLAELSHTHGVRPAKYTVVPGRDGAERIRAGKRHLNVSDFLTKELNLSWREAAPLLRAVYGRQLAGEPIPTPRELPRAALWREYAQQREAHVRARRLAWDEQRTSEQQRREALRGQWDDERASLKQDLQLRPAARRAATSLARAGRLGREDALRETIARERAELRLRFGPAAGPAFADWLRSKAQQGDERALEELRRTARPPADKPADVDDSKPNEIRLHGRQPTEQNAILFRSAGLSWRVDERGHVTYQCNGRDVVRDRGPNVQVLQIDRAAIEAGLRLARSKFGRTLELAGHDAFQLEAVKVAVDAGLRIQFSDERLNRAMHDYQRLRVDTHLHEAPGGTPVAPVRDAFQPASDQPLRDMAPDDVKPAR